MCTHLPPSLQPLCFPSCGKTWTRHAETWFLSIHTQKTVGSAAGGAHLSLQLKSHQAPAHSLRAHTKQPPHCQLPLRDSFCQESLGLLSVDQTPCPPPDWCTVFMEDHLPLGGINCLEILERFLPTPLRSDEKEVSWEASPFLEKSGCRHTIPHTSSAGAARHSLQSPRRLDSPQGLGPFSPSQQVPCSISTCSHCCSLPCIHPGSPGHTSSLFMVSWSLSETSSCPSQHTVLWCPCPQHCKVPALNLTFLSCRTWAHRHLSYSCRL